MQKIEEYTCNKLWFATRREALATLRSGQQPRYVKSARNLQVYHCQRCDGWHLTSVTSTAWQQRRRAMRRAEQAERRALEAALHGDEEL